MNSTNFLRHPLGSFEAKHNWANLDFAHSIMVFLQVFYIPKFRTLNVVSSCQDQDACDAFWDVFSNIHVQLDSIKMQVVNIPPNQNIRVPGPWQQNLIFVDSYEAFLSLDVASYTENYDFKEYYYIYVQMKDDRLLEFSMQQIFQYCWDNQLIHCSIQNQKPGKEILIYTYFPFTQEHCYQVKPQLLGMFSDNPKQYFPRKLGNFYGCAIIAALFDSPPYVSLGKSEHGEYQIVGGFEGELIFQLQNYLNFSLDIIVPPNNENRGKVYGNVTTGAIGMLLRKEAHFSLGGFRQNYERVNLLTSTLSHYQTSMSLMIKMSNFRMQSYEIFFFAFQWDLWLMFLFVYMTIFAYAVLAVRLHSPSLIPCERIFLDMFASLLGNTITLPPTSILCRYSQLFWLFYTFLSRCIYTAALYGLLRTNLNKSPPQTMHDLLVDGFTIVSNDITYDSMKQLYALQPLAYAILNSTSDFIALEYIQDHNERLVAAIPLDYVHYFIGDMNNTDEFYKLPFDAFAMPFSIFLTKHSYLTEEFADYLMALIDFGLLNYWADNVLKQKQSGKQALKTRDTLFTMEILYFPFELYATGLILASLVFCFELFVQHSKTCRALKLFKIQ